MIMISFMKSAGQNTSIGTRLAGREGVIALSLPHTGLEDF
jgi:hypothetical protein